MSFNAITVQKAQNFLSQHPSLRMVHSAVFAQFVRLRTMLDDVEASLFVGLADDSKSVQFRAVLLQWALELAHKMESMVDEIENGTVQSEEAAEVIREAFRKEPSEKAT